MEKLIFLDAQWWRSCLLAALLTTAAVGTVGYALTASAARPAAASSEARIRQLLELLDVGTTTAEMGPLIAEQFALTLMQENPEVAEGVSASFRQALVDVLGFDLDDAESRLWRSYVDLYQRNFSAAEIDDLIAFYSSPTGRKYLHQQAVLFEESGLVLQAWVYGAKDRVILRFEELMAQRSLEPEVIAN
ncbi:MAG: DUF2059 domain-containing protein [Pseudomonadota bacterium]